MTKIKQLFNKLIIALQFLTRIPIKVELDYSPANIGRSMVFYPVIGMLLGLLLALLNSFFLLFWSDVAAKALVLISLIILTGGLHLDGYMDTIDGLFSGRPKDRMLEIMRDSRVGAHGVTALTSLLLLKLVFLVELSGSIQLEALLLMTTFSRWAMVYAAAYYPYARQESGLGKAHADFVGHKEVVIASLGTVILAALLLGLNGLIAFILSGLATMLIIKLIIKKIQGLTGDCYGAINELIELFTLVILTLIY
ncbi:adenosylcobinamide-GDP ribazoletransferase [Fuchsiella alkaliacetigena]|uniref:adenosylcobinamide-GDP ribazoletransferase n=1 Tax=Fuchsiella alkaliacetigena TaxID=957042 RepID=UPI00200A6ADC|nr:adenosylcobinamide-GDP ribazoletransferase [Fuchsiella alkaliacetigena]MCK8825515.1 adenosylcobinamide-GDP ribazoletransferase [Fuchsiella alkaliacetigena]